MHVQFSERGYLDPIRVLTARQCADFLLSARAAPQPPDWDKGHAVSSRVFYEIATQPAIIEVLAALLGEDVMLWGASLRVRPPGKAHPWHSDVETSGPLGKTVSVWIGMEHTSRESSLQIIPYSHRFGATVQEMRHQLGKRRDELTDDEIVAWARERDTRADLVTWSMSDGEALFFDGKLWHGSHNLLEKTRRALLLQYATPDTPIRIPDLESLDWPFRQLDQPRPACLMIRGSATSNVNRVVEAPVATEDAPPRLTSLIRPLAIPLPPDEKRGWKPHRLFRGSTADVRSLTCHVSVLTHGHCPHPPHRHDEEELLLLLAGEVDLILPDAPSSPGNPRTRLQPGQLVYYPAQFAHTLEAVSEEPANYLMFKWRADAVEATSRLPFGRFDLSGFVKSQKAKEGFRPRRVFEGPTGCLRRLQCHVSTLTPEAGYAPHVDAYDVAIVVMEGEVETLGERVKPHGVIFYPAGEPHGIRNTGHATAKYVVFEFQRIGE
jgi:mannose-6-phosphate isomerase-like protein (cupin superfamily)